MSEVPVEGVDYIVDLYAAVDIPRDAEPAEIKSAVNRKTREYHPDRLEGMAPEFQAKGQHMSRILNHAREILLDEEKRAKYDGTLNEWDGLISTTGEPVTTPELWNRQKLRSQTPEAIEAAFESDKQRIIGQLNFSQPTLDMLERMVETLGDQAPDDVRSAYEDALLTYDRVLAIDEAGRSDLLSLPGPSQRRYEVLENYSETITEELEGARVTTRQDAVFRALGGVGTLKELESGSWKPTDDESTSTTIEAFNETPLPDYFEAQAEKVLDIARQREAIMERRLDNYRVTYVNPEAQPQAKHHLVVGLLVGNSPYWLGFEFDETTSDCNQIDIDAFTEALQAERFEELFDAGYNVATAKLLDQIGLNTLVNAIVTKHYDRLQSERDTE